MGIFLRKDSPYWWYQFKIKDQGRIQGSTSEVDKKLALEIALDERSKFVHGKRFNRASNITLCDLFDSYLKRCRIQPGYGCKFYGLSRIKEYFGKAKLAAEVTVDEVIEYRISRINAGVKQSSVNRELGPARNCFYDAMNSGRHNLQNNPFRSRRHGTFQFFSEKKFQRDRFLSSDEKSKLLPMIPNIGIWGPYVLNIVIFAMQTGLRQGEIRNLKWEDVDFSNRVIRVKAGEEDDNRYVPMFGETETILRSLEQEGPYVFWYRKGQPLKRHGFLKTTFLMAIRKSGISNFHFHDLRHTFVSDLVMAGVDFKTISEYVGHRLESMTSRYAHLSPKFKAAQINLLPSAMCYIGATEKSKAMELCQKVLKIN